MANTLTSPYNLFCLKELGFSAVWPLEGAGLSIGAYGLWENGLFTVAGKLQDLVSDIQLSPTQLVAGPLVATSKTMKRKEASASAAGSGGGVSATASVTYSSNEAHSFAVTLNGVSSQSLVDAETVLDNVAQAFDRAESRKWNPSYRIITQLWTANSYFMFGTASQSSTITLSGSATVVNDFMNGTISAGLSETQSHDGSLQVLENAVPKLVGMSFAAIHQLSPLKIDLNATHYS